VWWKSSSKLQGMYGLQRPTKENISISPFETIHSCTNQINHTHSTRGNICSNNQTKFLHCHKHINQTHQQTSDIQDLKNIMKSLFEQIGSTLNLLTIMLTKLGSYNLPCGTPTARHNTQKYWKHLSPLTSC
jgi:hypothetical protein